MQKNTLNTYVWWLGTCAPRKREFETFQDKQQEQDENWVTAGSHILHKAECNQHASYLRKRGSG